MKWTIEVQPHFSEQTQMAVTIIRNAWQLLVPTVMTLVGGLLTWQGRVSQRYHLAELEDRLLQDVNLCRRDVEREISKWPWQD